MSAKNQILTDICISKSSKHLQNSDVDDDDETMVMLSSDHNDDDDDDDDVDGALPGKMMISSCHNDDVYDALTCQDRIMII